MNKRSANSRRLRTGRTSRKQHERFLIRRAVEEGIKDLFKDRAGVRQATGKQQPVNTRNNVLGKDGTVERWGIHRCW